MTLCCASVCQPLATPEQSLPSERITTHFNKKGSGMKTSFALRWMAPVVVLGAGVVTDAHAQANAGSEALFQTIEKLDAQLFDAYNHCDLQKFGSMLSGDLEFYHDQTGLTRGREAIVESVKNNICGKVTRELVPGTLEVYPIANYGAVEIGVHRFHHPGHDNSEPVGEAKFTQLWQNKDGVWKLAVVISFDHHALSK
jgi:hypothetical protein